VSVAKALEGAVASGKEMEEKVMAAQNMETICEVLQGMYVCMYVSMYVRMYVCMYGYV
jgi:hypothetical protein